VAVALASPFVVVLDARQRAELEQLALSRTAPAGRVDRIDEFVLAYDEHDAKPYRWTYDGTPLKAA